MSNPALDKAVWQALNYHDRWFPVDIPLKGPSWEADIMSHRGDPSSPQELHLEDYPPVSTDWNLAMYALAKCRALPDISGVIHPASGVASGFVEDGNWSVAIGRYHYQGNGNGPEAICKAILQYRGCADV
jgi:hypothetical protein